MGNYTSKNTVELTVDFDCPIDAQGNMILKQELKEQLNEMTYEEIRQNPNSYGFTSKYLFLSANKEEFSSSAKISTLLNLAKLDLQKKTTIGELIFTCCQWFPKKSALESLIELGKENESEEKVARSIFEFQDHEGFTCLTVIFNMAGYYRNITKEYPTGPMLGEIEDSCSFLIELAKSAKLDFDKTLNHTTKSGATLFLDASRYSSKLMAQLLRQNVQVNSINHLFITPFFRVRLKDDF